jgi:hypothetical protein
MGGSVRNADFASDANYVLVRSEGAHDETQPVERKPRCPVAHIGNSFRLIMNMQAMRSEIMLEK